MLYICLVLQSGKDQLGRGSGDLEKFGIKSYVIESLDLLLQVASEIEVDVIFLNTSGLEEDGQHYLPSLSATGIPVIAITASKEEAILVRSLEVGATDIVHQSISNTLLALKTRRLIALHRSRATSAKFFGIHGLNFDLRNAKVNVDDIPLSISRRQFDLLLLIAQNFGKFVHRHTIYEALSQRGVENSRSSDMHVSRIRAKLREIGAYRFKIEAEYGLGYKLTCKEEIAPIEGSESFPSPSRSGESESMSESGHEAEQWTRTWLDSVSSGKVTMSQRKLSSVETRGGGLEVSRRLAEAIRAHLVELSEERRDLLAAASKNYAITPVGWG